MSRPAPGRLDWLHRYSSTELLAAVNTLRAASGKDLFIWNGKNGIYLCEREVTEPLAHVGYSIATATERLKLIILGTQLQKGL